MAQPYMPKQGDEPPPPYPGTELQNPNNYQAQQRVPTPLSGWGANPPPPPSHQHYVHHHQYQYGTTAAGTTVTTLQPSSTAITIPGNPTSIVVVSNGCPYCRVGVLTDSYDCFAIFLALFFFPIGILCCLAMRQKVCSNCGAKF